MRSGLISAAFVWNGFIFTAIAANYAFQNTHSLLKLIDSGHWLVVPLIMGTIIGWMGV